MLLFFVPVHTFKPVLSCKCHSNDGKVEEHDVIGVEYEVEQGSYDGDTAQHAKNHQVHRQDVNQIFGVSEREVESRTTDHRQKHAGEG